MPISARQNLASHLTGLSLITLERVRSRTLTFLSAVGTNAEVRSKLFERGYTLDAHSAGWKLLEKACWMDQPADFRTTSNKDVVQAIRATETKYNELVTIARASLIKRFPAHAEFIVRDFRTETDVRAVLNAALMLESLDALREGKADKALRGDAKKVLSLLSTRGIGDAWLKELASLVAKAQGSPDPVEEHDHAAIARSDERYVMALGALRDWYLEWSTIARVAVTRRDHLIQLGFVEMKPRRKATDASKRKSR